MANRFWVGGTGTWSSTNTTNWSATTGGAGGASVPGSADAAIFDASSGTGTVTTNYSPTVISTTISGANINLTLGANLTCSGTFTLTTSTLTLSNNTLTCNAFSSANSNTRSIAFGTGNITVTGSGAVIWTTATATGFTYTGTPTINFTYSGAVGTRTIGHGSSGGATESNSPNFNITAGSDIVSLSSTFNAKNVNFTGFSGTLATANRNIYGNLIFSSGMTCASGANTTTFAATSGIQQITTNGNSTIDFLITVNSPGATVQLQDNLTIGSTRTFGLTAGTLDLKNLTLTCGLFNSVNSNIRSIAFGTGNITLTGNNATIWTTAVANNFSYTGTPTINSTYSGSTGTRTLNHGNTSGTTEANTPSFYVTAGSDIVLPVSCKNLDFTGFTGTLSNFTRTIYGNLVISSGMSILAGSAVTSFGATSGVQQITTAGKTIDLPLQFNGVGGTFAFQDALTQGSTRAFTIVNGTVQLKNGVTSTVGSFAASNSNIKFLQSTTPGSQATLSQASGTVNVVDLTIRDINAVGGASWNAYTDFENTDAGNNDGWNFSLSPPYSTAELPITLRPFTQPRRF